MPYLALQGHTVVGCDCVKMALQQLVAENPGAAITSETSAGPLQVVDIEVDQAKGARMKFIVGDFFKLTPKVAGMFEAAFDRGSLVAIEPELRGRYKAVMDSLLQPGARILLVTVEVQMSPDPRQILDLESPAWD
eukprot:Tamp_13385.p2 GENE.Tamp_13385~~Tamp_13385.p2  ORF type:complete len:135 (+),score=30.62 Tamp_13385:494-898(+)